mgnify:CR=1 FL=1
MCSSDLVLFGETTKKENAELKDMDGREVAALVPLVVLAIVMGIAPMVFLRATRESVNLVKKAVAGEPAKVAVTR